MVKTRKSRAKKAKAKYKPKSPAKTKTDIIEVMMTDTIEGDLTSKAQAERILNSAFNAIIKFAADGDRVFVNNFGTFRCVQNKRQKFRTPDGNSVVVKDKNRITFEASKSFKETVNP